jgi:hypothetical protein
MKVNLSIFILVLWAAGSGLAQKIVPPPPALIYSAPAARELIEYTSTENNFKITFPGNPQVSKPDIEGGKLSAYRVYRQESNSIVYVYEFKNDLEPVKDQVYEFFKTNYLKIAAAKVEAERDVQTNGRKAREIDVATDSKLIKNRIVIVGSKVYELKSDVTNWPLLRDYQKDKVILFEAETKRFFDSFNLIEAPEPEIIPTTAEILGNFNKAVYRNEFFGFAIELPEDWHQFDPEEIDAKRQLAAEDLKKYAEKFDKSFRAQPDKETMVFVFANAANNQGLSANVAFGIIKQPSNSVTPEQVAASSKSFALKLPDIKLLKDIETFDVQGQKFASFSIESGEGGRAMKHKFLITIRRSYSLIFGLSYLDEESLKSVEKIFSTIKFDKK